MSLKINELLEGEDPSFEDVMSFAAGGLAAGLTCSLHRRPLDRCWGARPCAATHGPKQQEPREERTASLLTHVEKERSYYCWVLLSLLLDRAVPTWPQGQPAPAVQGVRTYRAKASFEGLVRAAVG